jgi:hypothetical protein
VRTPRRVAGLAAVTVLALGAAACGIAEAGTGRAPPTLADTLVAAVPDKSTPAFAFASQGCALSFSGVFDAPGNVIQGTVIQKFPESKASLAISIIAIGTDKPFGRYVFKPASLNRETGIPRTWVALNPAKIPNFQNSPYIYNGKIDPLGMGDVIRKASNLSRDGAGFTGTVDLGAFERPEAVISSTARAKLGDKAKTVPIEGVVDEASGRLTRLTFKIPSGKTCSLTYSKFGKVKKPSAPKAKKAPAAVYRLLNG